MFARRSGVENTVDNEQKSTPKGQGWDDKSTCRLILGDCRSELKKIADESVHFAVADPPYFLDGLDNNWRKGSNDAVRGTGSVGGLPVGMKFDPRDGEKLQEFIFQISEDLLRILKPGGFAAVFSQPRLSHRMATGIENAGFEIRDVLAWRYTRRAQFKAFSIEHFVEQSENSKKEKARLLRTLANRKTPQLRPQFESIILCQKPKVGTHLTNWEKHQTGLIDASATLDGLVPSTVMTVEKPQKDKFNSHPTVKPLQLITHLIKLFTLPDQVVIDPFLGSGTTAVAAKKLGRPFIGIEISPDYMEICNQRLERGQ